MAAIAGAIGILSLGGCVGTTEAPVARPSRPHLERAFLAEPLLGYSRSVSGEERARLTGAHVALVNQQDAASAAAAAAQLLARNPDLAPASVLLAQADYVSGDFAAARRRLDPVVEDEPDYFAARLLWARAAERLGDLPAAYDGYAELAGQSSVASERAEELRQRTLEVVSNRVADAIARGHSEEAGRHLSDLTRWAPGEAVTLYAARDLAEAVDDRVAELKAVRRLGTLFPEDRDLRLRWGELELEAGDASAGLRVFRELYEAEPDNEDLALQLERARFRWRLTLLPEKVKKLVNSAQLSRADFATMVYWLFPGVRSGRAGTGRIANDVFDHPQRQEIVRVVNLGLLPVDPDLHTFRPEEPQVRSQALLGLLKVLGRQNPKPACLGAGAFGAAAESRVCRAASQCRLIQEPGDCLPQAVLSGPDAFEMARSALDQLGQLGLE